jgi:5-formyltetrahydrofolate cyclo-ligase
MEDDERGGSDPCMEHLLIDGKPVDGATLRDVSRFRTAERSRLMELRRRIPTLDRTAMTATLCEAIETLDLRGWMKQAHNAGASLLLPVVVEKNAPLVFRAWSPDCEMERGIWNIPVPADGKEMVPDVVISPLLGIDEACFRLGNGGGYYDRTLARIDPPPKVIGVGFSDCVIPSIFPMPWDIPMDSVVLTDGSIRHRS